MNRKAKGTRAEHRSRQLLEVAGYSVIRAGGSLGTWDLVGIGSADIILCQVKCGSWPGSAELEQMRLFPTPPSARKLVHRWRDRVHLPDVREVP